MANLESTPRVAIIGMGGFAGSHHLAWRALEEQGECRLVCTCDPRPEQFREAATSWQLEARGVRVYDDYLRMLDEHAAELDIVAVPTPVPLHAAMHRAVVERGLACYLEKPPTLYDVELDEMLAVETQAVKATNVGFNFIVEPPRQALKQRLLAGEFGALKRVSFLGCWPRASTYFTRAAWAGKLLLDDRLVLDSCIGNAMAHYIHNLHFWCGLKALYDWEPVASVEAELYRAHDIENFDTCFVRGQCANGVEFVVAATHAAQGQPYQYERIECERAVIEYNVQHSYRVAWSDGREEVRELARDDLLRANFRAYLDYWRGRCDRPVTKLVDARPFVRFNNLIYVAARAIAPVPEDFITNAPLEHAPGQWVAVHGIQDALETFVATRRFPGQQGLAWGRGGGQATLADLPRLRNVVGEMRRGAPRGCPLIVSPPLTGHDALRGHPREGTHERAPTRGDPIT